MTLKLRARVAYHEHLDSEGWFAYVYDSAPDEHHRLAGLIRQGHRNFEWADSQPEAMQAAYKLLADLDHELMTEVHESRATRRAVNIPICAPECRMTPPYTHAPECERYSEEAP